MLVKHNFVENHSNDIGNKKARCFFNFFQFQFFKILTRQALAARIDYPMKKYITRLKEAYKTFKMLKICHQDYCRRKSFLAARNCKVGRLIIILKELEEKVSSQPTETRSVVSSIAASV